MIELVLKEEHVAEDGLWAVFAQFAQIITLRNVEETYIVLGSFKWAVLAWRLSEVQERGRCSGWQLQVEAGCSWQFLHNPEAWEACEATPEIVNTCRTLFQSHGWLGTTCAKHFALRAQKDICGVDIDGGLLECDATPQEFQEGVVETVSGVFRRRVCRSLP